MEGANPCQQSELPLPVLKTGSQDPNCPEEVIKTENYLRNSHTGFHRRELPPMQNPTILANLFQHCSPGTLAACRLVCRQWRDISLRSWRSSVLLKFRHYYRHGDVLLACCYHNNFQGTPLHKFLSFWKRECGTKPFSQFQLERVNFSFEDEKLALKIDRFVELVGPHVTRMNFELCFFSGPQQFRKIIFQAFPNLRSLTLRGCCYQLGPSDKHEDNAETLYKPNFNLTSLYIVIENGTVLPVSWLELLSHFPSLNAFTLSGNNKALQSSDYEDMLEAVRLIRKQPGGKAKLPLKQFDFGKLFKISNGMECLNLLELLRQLNIQLCAVRMGHGMTETVMTDVLQSHGCSLKKISALRSTPPPNFPFPSGISLENLQILQIWEGFCKNLEFVKWMPNLKKIHITADNFLWNGILYRRPRQFLPSSNEMSFEVKLYKLKEFRLDAFISEEFLRIIIPLMPNVRKVGMMLNDKRFALICEQWRELVEVEDFGYQLTDEGVTGMRFSADGRYPSVAFRPSITFLTDLERFSSRSRKLTDLSVSHGFMKLSEITHITFSSRALVGNTAKNELRKKGVTVWENSSTFLTGYPTYDNIFEDE